GQSRTRQVSCPRSLLCSVGIRAHQTAKLGEKPLPRKAFGPAWTSRSPSAGAHRLVPRGLPVTLSNDPRSHWPWDELERMVHDKLCRGALFALTSDKYWAARGTGEPCRVCSQPISRPNEGDIPVQPA